MNVEVLESAAFLARLTPTGFQAFIANNTGSVDPDSVYANEFGSAGTAAKRIGYSNPTVDDLIAKASAETDRAKRKSLYAQINQIALVDDARMLPYRTPTDVKVAADKVKGLTQLATRTVRPATLWLTS